MEPAQIIQQFAAAPPRLALTRQCTTPQAQQTLCDQLASNVSLGELNLEACAFAKSLPNLVNVLLTNQGSALQVLGLRDNGLGPADIPQLMRLVQASPRLRKLDLSHNNIGMDPIGALNIMKAIKANPLSCMTVVNFASNNISLLPPLEVEDVLLARPMLYLHLVHNPVTVNPAGEMARVMEILKQRYAMALNDRGQSAQTPAPYTPPQSTQPIAASRMASPGAVAPAVGGIGAGPKCCACGTVMLDFRYRCMQCLALPRYDLCTKCYPNASRLHDASHSFIGMEIDLEKWRQAQLPAQGGAPAPAPLQQPPPPLTPLPVQQSLSPMPQQPIGFQPIGVDPTHHAAAIAALPQVPPPVQQTYASTQAIHLPAPPPVVVPPPVQDIAPVQRPAPVEVPAVVVPSAAAAPVQPVLAPAAAPAAAPRPTGQSSAADAARERYNKIMASLAALGGDGGSAPSAPSRPLRAGGGAAVSTAGRGKVQEDSSSSDGDDSSDEEDKQKKQRAAASQRSQTPPSSKPAASNGALVPVEDGERGAKAQPKRAAPKRASSQSAAPRRRRAASSSSSSSSSSRSSSRSNERVSSSDDRRRRKRRGPAREDNSRDAPGDRDERHAFGIHAAGSTPRIPLQYGVRHPMDMAARADKGKAKQSAVFQSAVPRAVFEVKRAGGPAARAKSLSGRPVRRDYASEMGPGAYGNSILEKPRGAVAKERPPRANTRGRPVWV